MASISQRNADGQRCLRPFYAPGSGQFIPVAFSVQFSLIFSQLSNWLPYQYVVYEIPCLLTMNRIWCFLLPERQNFGSGIISTHICTVTRYTKIQETERKGFLVGRDSCFQIREHCTPARIKNPDSKLRFACSGQHSRAIYSEGNLLSTQRNTALNSSTYQGSTGENRGKTNVLTGDTQCSSAFSNVK